MQNLRDRLKEFKRHCGFYPTTEQGLQALIEKPVGGGRECKRYAPGGYIEGERVPLDPWDSEYVYESDGKTIKIVSLGSDGEPGGEAEDQDIELGKKNQY